MNRQGWIAVVFALALAGCFGASDEGRGSSTGAVGSLGGAVTGGFVLAGIEVTLDATLPADVAPFRDAFSLLIVIAILYLRPEGILRRPSEATL